MLNDPLANVLSKALNYERLGRAKVELHPAGKLIKRVFGILNEKGYVGAMDEVTPARGGVVTLHLLGAMNKCGVIKPRFSVQRPEFEKFEKRYLPAKGVGVLVVSTPLGLMTHDEAKAKGIGGRLVAYCY